MVAFILPIALLAIMVVVMFGVASFNARKSSKQTVKMPEAQAVGILVHSINDDRCTGCDACVAVCPTNVLDLVENKSKVLRFEDCIQCEACMWACPTTALVMHNEGTEPPPLQVPELDKNFQTAVEGQYLIGEVSGKPLVKNAANLGRAVVDHMIQGGLTPRQDAGNGSNLVDVAIVGSGPGGLSAALTCIKHGLSYIIFEKEQQIASTIARYPKGKLVMAEPYDVRNVSYLPVYDSSKEELIPVWQEMLNNLNVRITLGETVEKVAKHSSGLFKVKTNMGKYAAQRVVLATGTRGKPRTLGVPGENLPKVRTLLEDPDEFRGMPVIVVGGGDSAVEAAMSLADAGASVLVSYRGKGFTRAQAKNKKAIEGYVNQRKIKVVFQSEVSVFEEETVGLRSYDGSTKSYPNQAAFVLIGSEPPIKWLAKVGVHFVDRPHQYQLGKTDAVAGRNAVGEIAECPETASGALALLGYGAAAAQASVVDRSILTEMPEEPQEVSVVAKLAHLASNVVRRKKPPQRFGHRSRTHGALVRRRDAMDYRERARYFRSLRDDGAVIADREAAEEFREASRVFILPTADNRNIGTMQPQLTRPVTPTRDPRMPGAQRLQSNDSTKAVDLQELAQNYGHTSAPQKSERVYTYSEDSYQYGQDNYQATSGDFDDEMTQMVSTHAPTAAPRVPPVPPQSLASDFDDEATRMADAIRPSSNFDDEATRMADAIRPSSNFDEESTRMAEAVRPSSNFDDDEPTMMADDIRDLTVTPRLDEGAPSTDFDDEFTRLAEPSGKKGS